MWEIAKNSTLYISDIFVESYQISGKSLSIVIKKAGKHFELFTRFENLRARKCLL